MQAWSTSTLQWCRASLWRAASSWQPRAHRSRGCWRRRVRPAAALGVQTHAQTPAGQHRTLFARLTLAARARWRPGTSLQWSCNGVLCGRQGMCGCTCPTAWHGTVALPASQPDLSGSSLCCARFRAMVASSPDRCSEPTMAYGARRSPPASRRLEWPLLTGAKTARSVSWQPYGLGQAFVCSAKWSGHKNVQQAAA